MPRSTPIDSATAGPTLAAMLFQYQTPHLLVVAAQLGLADLLAEGPRGADELASLTGTHPRALYRLLRALAGIGVFVEDEERRFALTPLGEPLRSGVPGSLYSAARYAAVVMRAWGELLYGVQTGGSPWERALGAGYSEYFARNPELHTHFNTFMTENTRRELPDILGVYDFSGIDTLVDLGGGRGLFLSGVLQKYPEMRGVLFDLPRVVTEAPSVLADAGVTDRCQIIGGDFLTGVPSGGDAYVLKNVVHGVRDAEAVQVFRTCHAAMGGHGRLLVIGILMGEGAAGGRAAQADLHIMVIAGEAGVRTEEETRALLAAGGFRVTRVVPAGRGGAIVEAIPV